MTKVDFSKIEVMSITGGTEQGDFRQELGKALFLSRSEEDCKLGMRIFNSEGEMEITEREAKTIRLYIANYAWVARSAIEKALNIKEEE